jgi:ribose 5-phosphate isomerase B
MLSTAPFCLRYLLLPFAAVSMTSSETATDPTFIDFTAPSRFWEWGIQAAVEGEGLREGGKEERRRGRGVGVGRAADRDTDAVRIAVAADERVGVAPLLVERLSKRGHEVLAHGALAQGEREDWAWASEAAARDVAAGRAEQAVVCCWTGTGASIAANKVRGVRAALCLDAASAAGARRWNDANALALSLRATSEAELEEILDAWFSGEPSAEEDDRANVEHLGEIERGRG